MGTTTRSASANPAATGEPRLSDALVQFTRLIDHLFAEASREQGVTPQQAELLCELMRGPVGMTDLTAALHVERSTLTGLVDRLERRGLVSRIRDPADRRAYQITLTAEGARIGMASYDDVTARVAEITHGVATPDRKRLATIVAGILADHGVPVVLDPVAPEDPQGVN